MGKAGSKIRKYITPYLTQEHTLEVCEVIRHLERDYLAVHNPLFRHLEKMSKNGKNHPEHIMLKLLVGISSYILLAFFVRGQVQMMCLVWQFSLVHLTLILSQLKIGTLHEHDDISKNVSNFSFQNFVWAAGRCFLLICFAFWKHRIFHLVDNINFL